MFNKMQVGNFKDRSELVDRKVAAEFLGVKAHTLAVWATTHKYKLPYVKIGRLVKYRISDLEAFVEQNLQQHNQIED